jgi:hypothetical protein
MTRHFILETADALTYSYETIALRHRHNHELSRSPSSYPTTFPLLILNASIVEGILRFWLASSVKNEMKRLVTQGQSLGKTAKDKAEQLLERYLIEIEGNGGFDKLKGQYGFFFDISLDGKDPHDPTYNPDPIKVLFTLRNVIAHGTTLVAPKIPAGSPKKDEYVDSWQSRLQLATSVLKGATSTTNIFDALQDYRTASFFFEQSRVFLKRTRLKLLSQDIDDGAAFKAFTDLEFGYRNRTM